MFLWIGGSVRNKHGHKCVTHVQKDDGKEENLDISSSNSIKSLKKLIDSIKKSHCYGYENFVSYCIIEEVKEVWEEKSWSSERSTKTWSTCFL